MTFTVEIQNHLKELKAERKLASTHGLTDDAGYIAELENEIVEVTHAYVAAAVTEIAVLRAELSGPQAG
jgi:hypothetical protein